MLRNFEPLLEEPYRPRPKLSPKIELTREEVKTWAGDLFPLSVRVAQQLIADIVGHPVTEITENSGTTFMLRFGPDIENKTRSLPRWHLSVDELWNLFQGETLLLDAERDKFTFIEKLKLMLLNQCIIKFGFEHEGKSAEIHFSNGYTVRLKESGRYSRWYLHDYLTGLSLGSYRDEQLVYRLSIPDHLEQKYQSEDIHLNNIRYQLDFLRDFLAKD